MLYTRHEDRLVRKHTGFTSFADLLDARGGYFPSLDVSSPERLAIADAYDRAQEARGDERA